MGRKRMKKVGELNVRDMLCSKCNSVLVEVMDDKVESVTCTYCANGVIPLSALNEEQLAEYDKEEAKQIAQQKAKQNQPKYSKNGKRLGRPPKRTKNIDTKTATEVIEKLEKKPEPEQPKKKVVKKKKRSKKMDTNQKGKRGRKSTVGAKILSFMESKKGENVPFSDILNVYSEERERMGKKNPDPKVEERNCYSSLYIMVRDGKLEEVEKKSVYKMS